jgi:serine/threonine-protein kinase
VSGPAARHGNDEPYVFICYSHAPADVDIVLGEINWLRDRGVSVWYDEGISPGAEWREELGEAIRNCGLFLFFVSPESIASPNCRRELNFALDQNRPTLAVHLRETPLSDGLRLSLNDRQAILRHAETEVSYREKLLSSIDHGLALSPGPGRSDSLAHRASRRTARRRAGQLLIVALTATLAGLGAWWLKPPPPDTRHVTRFEIRTEAPLSLQFARAVTISPDGQRIAFGMQESVGLRELGRLAPRVLPMAGEALHFSPDGQRIAFGGGSSVAVTGGATTRLAPSSARPFGGTWGTDGKIYFADGRGLFRVDASGGEAELLARPDESAGEVAFTGPAVLPGNRSLLLTVLWEDAVSVVLFDLESRTRRMLIPGGNTARLAGRGHLVYSRGNRLEAVRFDPDTAAVRGQPLELDVRVAMSRGVVANFDVSENGTLIYVPARSGGYASLVWVDRVGNVTPSGAPDQLWIYPRLSPDGRYVVSDLWEFNRDLYLWDFERLSMMRLTTHPNEDMLPVWDADGRTLLFASDRGGVFQIYAVPADGSRKPQLMTSSSDFLAPVARVPGTSTLLVSRNAGQGFDLMAVDMAEPQAAFPLIATDASELNAAISPDGRWLAYQSDSTGQNEIYVEPFAAIGERRFKVSTAGGATPWWSPTTQELFFVSTDESMMAAEWQADPEFRVSTPRKLFDASSYHLLGGGRKYDVSADGRFLMSLSGDAEPPQTIVVVTNWFEELLESLPTEPVR